MRPRQKNCGDKTRRWKGGGGDMQSIKAQQRLGILQSMQNNWIPNFPCHEKMSGKPKKKTGVFFIFFGLGELWLQKIGPPTAKSLCHSEGQKQSVLKRRRCGVSETTPTMRCCPWFVAFLLDTFFLQKHWIYRWVFLWFGQFIEMSPYRKALLFLWGANPKAGSGSLHQGAIDSHLSLSNV